MPGWTQRFVAVHGVWLLVILTLLAAAERRVAAYASPMASSPAVESADAVDGDRVVLILVLLADARPPVVGPAAVVAPHREAPQAARASARPRTGGSRSPPPLRERQRAT